MVQIVHVHVSSLYFEGNQRENIEGNQTTYPPDTRGDALTIELQSRCPGKVTV